MRSACVLLLVAVHLSWGAESFDRIERPHVGTVRHTGSIPVVSTPRASRDRSPSAARMLTISMASGMPEKQVRCLLRLWTRESNFRPQALNKHSGAGGIPQILGLDPKTPTREQIRRGLTYIAHRYDTPCRALRHHYQHGWY
jgi:hypothetical protein